MSAPDNPSDLAARPQRSAPSWLRIAGIALLVLACVAVDWAVRQCWSPPAESEAVPATWYGAWVLAPAIFTIVLAMLARQVVVALTLGILLAACLLVPFQPAGTGGAGGIVGGVQLAVGHYLVGAVADTDHAKVIIFSLVICGMVGVIAANGGTGAVVRAVARWGSTPRRGQVATWLAGLLVFFDDYANAMIVGPSMRPVCDRLRISRAKLAYIVDSTAAPVSSIALIGTWVGTEVGFIDAGMRQLTSRPAFMADISAYEAFLTSIPYRFYAILALVMVLLVGWLGRDFGPMLRAERRARAEHASGTGPSEQAAIHGSAWYAVVPVFVLVAVTLVLLFVGGYQAVDWASFSPPPDASPTFARLQAIVSNANAYDPILYAAFAATAVAVLMSVGGGVLTLRQTFDSLLESMSRLLPTIVVLVLAWTLSGTMKDLQLGDVAVNLLKSIGFDSPQLVRALPVCVFLSAAVVSFATGTSWGTMGILCPAVVTIAAGLLDAHPVAEAQPIFYAAIGAVLSGAVFGDHCSPISDTTILSSLASDCALETHVWTQMPYAVVVAGVSMATGDVLCRYGNLPAWAGLAIGAAALFLILRTLGRPPGAAPKPVPERRA